MSIAARIVILLWIWIAAGGALLLLFNWRWPKRKEHTRAIERYREFQDDKRMLLGPKRS